MHSNIKNTLNYGVLSIFKEHEFDKEPKVYATFTKSRVDAIQFLRTLNRTPATDLIKQYSLLKNVYTGQIDANEQNLFITMDNKVYQDKSYIILNNPP